MFIIITNAIVLLSKFSKMTQWIKIYYLNIYSFKQRRCLKVSRSAPICGTGRGGVPREQLNENTAFIDASPLYGSSFKDLHKFRQARTGFLRMSKFNNQMVRSNQ